MKKTVAFRFLPNGLPGFALTPVPAETLTVGRHNRRHRIADPDRRIDQPAADRQQLLSLHQWIGARTEVRRRSGHGWRVRQHRSYRRNPDLDRL